MNQNAEKKDLRSKKAFTLIELLVVISIIALLLAILMPALSKARELARAAAGMSNLHQWAVMWKMYTDDHDGKFPDPRRPEYGGWPRGVWLNSLRDYYEDELESGILLCPSAKNFLPNTEPGSYQYADAAGDTTHAHQFINADKIADVPEDEDLVIKASYGANLWLFDPSGNTPIQGRPMSYHWRTAYQRRAMEIPMFGDCRWRGGGPHMHMSRHVASEPPAVPDPPRDSGMIGAGHEMANWVMDRHSGGINMCFMDGSTRKVDVRELWTLRWSRDWDPANIYTKRGDNTYTWPDWLKQYPAY